MTDPTAAATKANLKRVRTRHFQSAKENGVKITGLTSYDQLTASIFDAAGIDFLLVGDSAGNNVLGYETTLPVTVEDLIPLTRAVAGAVTRAFVVADMPFGSYETGPDEALHTAFRFMKETHAHAVKLEGGVRSAEQIGRIVSAGIPVMGHIGFTPQSEHKLGGYRVQGRGDSAAQLLEDAHALERAGAFAVVLEMVPGPVAREVTAALAIPTIGIGAGRDCDAQVLVWQDMAGLTGPSGPRFVKRYADLRGYQYDRSDVTSRGLANAYAQTLGTVFTQEPKPYEIEIVVAEVGQDTEHDQIYRLTYDGSVADQHGYVVMGGTIARAEELLEGRWRAGLSLGEALGNVDHRCGESARAVLGAALWFPPGVPSTERGDDFSFESTAALDV